MTFPVFIWFTAFVGFTTTMGIEDLETYHVVTDFLPLHSTIIPKLCNETYSERNVTRQIAEKNETSGQFEIVCNISDNTGTTDNSLLQTCLSDVFINIEFHFSCNNSDQQQETFIASYPYDNIIYNVTDSCDEPFLQELKLLNQSSDVYWSVCEKMSKTVMTNCSVRCNGNSCSINTICVREIDPRCLIPKYVRLTYECEQDSRLVTTIQYPEQNTLNISCWNTSQIQIQNIDVQVEGTPCRTNSCVLNSQDTQTLENNCNGEHSCLVDYNFTSSCLREFRYINLSYTCKHENNTSLSTFEKDYGDWKFDSSNNTTWIRNDLLPDHTRLEIDKKGYSIHAISYNGRAGTVRIGTDNEFMEPICLSLWYQFYVNSYDCIFNIYKITNEKQTLLFTVNNNSTIFDTWINILIDAYEQGPFKILLEADFTQHISNAARVLLIDDTSISYRPCKGQQVHSTCLNLQELIEIECETQYLASEIELFLEPENSNNHLKNCPAESIKNEINSFCTNLNKTDKCKFSVLNFTNGNKVCYVSSKNISVSYQCKDKSKTTTSEKSSTESSTMFKDNFQTTHRSEISADASTTLGAGIPVIIVSTLVILIVAALVIIMIVCIRKKRAKNSILCQSLKNTTTAEMIDSSHYNVINFDEMKDTHNRKINENKTQTHTTQHQPQKIKNTSEKDENICNKYESLSTNRNSVDHIYESDSIHTNTYDSLTKQRELDTHTYESSEQALPQNMKTSIKQYENICNRYESLSTNRNPAEHMYELDSIPINHYQSLKKQQELDEHTYESTEHASQVSMNQELSQYESLTHPPESEKHVYASTLSQQ